MFGADAAHGGTARMGTTNQTNKHEHEMGRSDEPNQPKHSYDESFPD